MKELNKNNKFIGNIIKDNKVIFKANNNIYIKKIKEKNKTRRLKYTTLESVNIICDDLDKKYVLVDSDNQSYFNKFLLSINVIGIFLNIIFAIIFLMDYINLIILFIINHIVLFLLLMIQLFYVVIVQDKKKYKNYTKIVEGEIINYSRTEYPHDKDEFEHCKYNIMYKYKTPDGNIIHSVVHEYSARLLYKDYPLNSKVLVRYNPLKCCESCLADEYDSLFSNKPFVKSSSFIIMAIGKITSITTKCFDSEVEEYLKEYCLVDYIECEYTVSGIKYKTTSIFGVPHNRFKIGEEIRIFYEQKDNSKFYCDINRKYSNSDKY